MVFSSCSPEVSALAVIGGAVLYLLIGALIGALVNKILKDADEAEVLVVFSVIFWPIAIVAGLIYIIGMYVFFPLFGATKADVRAEGRRLDARIDEQCSEPLDVSNDYVAVASTPSFKEGDVITGIVPQTDYDGNNISYNHLYQGCKCRVLSIKESGSMRVILIDHVDKEAQKDSIGKTFIAPARNFKLVKNPVKTRKVVNAKKK